MSKEIYNSFFKKYGPHIHTDPIRFNAIAKLCQGKVLDIACGTGDLSDFYKGDYTGIDISDVAIEMAKKVRRKDANFFVKDVIEKTSDVNSKFDTIVMAEFLEHIKNDKILFENIKNWAKPGTRLVISVPNGDKVPDKDHVRQFTVPKIRKEFKELGKIKFHNFEGFKYRILFTIDLNQKNDDLISLVMPVKNEGKGLERAILSCIDFVDNIIISVDTNSKDNTLQIAKKYADVLKQYQWKNSFADARNFAQEGIKTKWILALDGHEYIKQYPYIENALNSDADGLFIRIILESGFSFYFPRIIKNNIKWTKDVHNYPLCKKIKKYSKFIITHDRTTGQAKEAIKIRLEQRNKMVVRILHQKIKENKKDCRSLFYLAQLYGSQRETKKAIKCLKKYLKYSKNNEERWLACYDLGNLFNNSDKPKHAIKFFKKAHKELPKRWEIEKRIGTTYMLLKKWNLGAEHLVNSFNIDKIDFMFKPEQRNNAQTWFYISQCFFALRKYEEGRIALKRAERSQTSSKWGKLPKTQIKIIKEITQ